MRAFIRKRGVGTAIALLLGIPTIVYGMISVVRSFGDKPIVWIPACLIGLCVIGIAIFCYVLVVPSANRSDETTEIETSGVETEASPDPSPNANTDPNVDGAGPVIEVPQGSHVKVPPRSTVRLIESDKKQADNGEGTAEEGS